MEWNIVRYNYTECDNNEDSSLVVVENMLQDFVDGLKEGSKIYFVDMNQTYSVEELVKMKELLHLIYDRYEFQTIGGAEWK